jgi:hypothetical protein
LRRVVTDEGLRFFELRVPIELTRDASRLTTDNIFDLLAGFRSDDSESTSYTREFPFEATADYYDLLDLLLRNELSNQKSRDSPHAVATTRSFSACLPQSKEPRRSTHAC